MSKKLFEYCVYTTAHPDRLKEAMESGNGSGTFTESREWVTGRALLAKVLKDGFDMAIVFSDAASDCSSLIYWAVLREIEIKDKQTRCTFECLRRLPEGHKTQQLRLRSTEEFIAPGFIRPYAICETPV